MKSNRVTMPYRYHWRMTDKQLAYVVFVLVEKNREEHPNDIPPKWWPKNIAFHHPMVREYNQYSNIYAWRNQLREIVESYYKCNGESWWFRQVLSNTLSHLICVEKNEMNNSEHGNNNLRQYKKPSVKRRSLQKKDPKIRVKESVLLKLLPQPVVFLYDVVKYGLVTNKEEFLLKLNLIKSDPIVNNTRYKYKKLLPNTKKLPTMPKCFVKLTRIEDSIPYSKNKTDSDTISISSTSSVHSSPTILPNYSPSKIPYVVLTPCTHKFPAARKPIHFLSPSRKIDQSAMEQFFQILKGPNKSQTYSSRISKRHSLSTSLNLKKKRKRKSVIKIKWMPPRLKMRISV